MKLTDTSIYLSLIRETFKKTIQPELQTASAKAAADLIEKVLGELARRTDGLPARLIHANREGAAIAAAMRTALQAQGVSLPETTSLVAAGHTDFDSAAAEFAQLNTDIDAMATQLRTRQGHADLLRRAARWEAESHIAFAKVPIPEPHHEAESDPLPQDALEAFLKTVHPAGDRLRVTKLDPIPGGYANQTTTAEIDDGTGKRVPLIIRKRDKNPCLTHPSWDKAREFLLQNTLFRLGYPVPRALWLGRQVPGIDADFMVMEKAPGKMIGALLGGADDAVPESLMLEVAALLGRLHSIELEQFSDLIERFDDPALLTDTVEQYNRRLNAGWREYASSCERLPSPLVDYILDWLDEHVPDDKRRPVLLHGDYSVHNMLGENGRVTAVLDWEAAMFGAPELDLGYAQPAVSQYIEWERFLDHYVASGGRPPAQDSFTYYIGFNNVRILLNMNRGMMYLQNRTARDIRFSQYEQGFVPRRMEKVLNQVA